ncbi:MAG: hypothetical protein LUE63_09065 [Lachnospiraceae bacterium]|nr:hypothetical protein [Lachnospiraceae bacterium]
MRLHIELLNGGFLNDRVGNTIPLMKMEEIIMMSYSDGAIALQFPDNYILIDEDEIEYLDGGVSETRTMKAGTAAIYFTAGYWAAKALALAGTVSFAALGCALGGPFGAAVGSISGLFGAGILNSMAKKLDAAATKCETYSSSQKLKITETLNSRLVYSVSIKKA